MTSNRRMHTDTSLPASAHLGREYADFFLALSAAFQRCQIYPGGHPTVDRAVDQVVRRLEPLLADLPAVAFAVSPNQLTIGGAATDPEHALLRELSGRLFRRNVGRVRIGRGITRSEVASLLISLGQERETSVPAASPHVEIDALNFEGLGLGTGLPDDEEPGVLSRGEAAWADLSQIMLEGSGIAEPPTDPDVLAGAFESTPADPARDARVIEALAEAAIVCRSIATSRAVVMRRQITRLLRGLGTTTLRRLLAATSGVRQQSMLMDLLRVAAAPAALDLVVAASQVEHRTMSPALVQLLTKLASHAETGPAASRQLADEQFHAALRELIEGWHAPEVSDATALEYEETLDHLPAPLVPDLDPTEAYRSDPLRLVTMHLDMQELDAVVDRAVRTLVARGRVRPLVDLLYELTPEDRLTDSFRPMVATPDAIVALLAAHPIDLDTLTRLAPEVGTPAIPLLLQTLGESEERSVRRRLLDLLPRFGNAVTPYVMERLDGAPWYVQRNLLRLLQVMPDPPAEAVANGFALDPDPRVRVEGLRLLLRHPAARARGISQGLADPDPACQRVAVMAAADGCPLTAAGPLLRRVMERSLEADLRPIAVRALAPLVDEPAVLECLLKVAARRIPVFGLVVAPKTKSSLSALAGLALHWRWHPRTARLLARAERHRDPAVRASVAGPTVFEQLGLISPSA